MADKAQPDEHRQQKEDIEDFGTVALTQGAHVIHCLTVIGQDKFQCAKDVAY